MAELESAELAAELRPLVGRMIRRLRAVGALPLTQASVLGRLDRDGPQCIGELAAGESVRPQSMSQTLVELETDGLVARSPDARDGRRTRIRLTDLGLGALQEDRASREGWLAQAISQFTPDEQETLSEAVELMRRLAGSA
jgi:DNA-binding MarR family transcriptional regulator